MVASTQTSLVTVSTVNEAVPVAALPVGGTSFAPLTVAVKASDWAPAGLATTTPPMASIAPAANANGTRRRPITTSRSTGSQRAGTTLVPARNLIAVDRDRPRST